MKDAFQEARANKRHRLLRALLAVEKARARAIAIAGKMDPEDVRDIWPPARRPKTDGAN